MSEILQTEYKYKESPYKFIELNDGFHITGSERCPVDVRLVNNGKALLVESNGEFHQLGLFQYYRLVELIAKLLLANWTPRGEKYYPDWLRFWGRNNTSRSIYKRVHAQWQRLLTMADPLAIQVQRAIFAATRNTAILAMEDEMYQNYWLINDIQNYRAAALATVKIESILWYRNRTLREAQVYRFKYEFYSQKSLDGSWCVLSTRPPLMIDRTYQLGFLQEWRNLFSYNGRAYHSLNRTLMNLPGGIPIYFLPSLADIELPRPITNRLELSLVLATLNNRIIENLPIILYAQADQEKHTMELLAAHLNRELSHRRWHDIRLLAMYLSDYPEKHTGNIVGLIKKSIDWHREQAAMDVLQVIDKYGNANAALPPIAFPMEETGITFLSNVNAICKEGNKMQHCISRYAKNAIQGSVNLFHVEKDGEEASVMVTYNGEIPQAFGPRNCQNKASKWGSRVLRRWGISSRYLGSAGKPNFCNASSWVIMSRQYNK